MKILFDTNVILDIMLLRKPFYKTASILIAEAELKRIKGYVCATTVTTIYYLVEKVLDQKEAKNKIENILNIFDICEVNRSVLESALHSGFSDFEDSVIYESARRNGIEGIVTRNRKDFESSKIPVFDPEELLKILSIKL
jgi:predicted nucleic acid-binding protein